MRIAVMLHFSLALDADAVGDGAETTGDARNYMEPVRNGKFEAHVGATPQLAGATTPETIRYANLSADHHDGGIIEKIVIKCDANDVLVLIGHFEGVDALAHVSIGQGARKDKDAIEVAKRR